MAHYSSGDSEKELLVGACSSLLDFHTLDFLSRCRLQLTYPSMTILASNQTEAGRPYAAGGFSHHGLYIGVLSITNAH